MWPLYLGTLRVAVRALELTDLRNRKYNALVQRTSAPPGVTTARAIRQTGTEIVPSFQRCWVVLAAARSGVYRVDAGAVNCPQNFHDRPVFDPGPAVLASRDLDGWIIPVCLVA
jgi:hypothetical protein